MNGAVTATGGVSTFKGGQTRVSAIHKYAEPGERACTLAEIDCRGSVFWPYVTGSIIPVLYQPPRLFPFLVFSVNDCVFTSTDRNGQAR